MLRKHKSEGFTLIELLTVIAILAVILLISIPIILGVLDRARKNSFKNQVLLYVEALKQQTGMALMGSGYSELKSVDNSFYAPTVDSDNKLVRVSVSNLNKVMDNVVLTNDDDKYFYVEYTTTGYNYYIGEGVRKEGEYSTTCDNTCVTKTYNSEEIRLINFKTFTTSQIVRGDTEVSPSNPSEPSTPSEPVADTTVPTVSATLAGGLNITLTMSDNVGIASYCISETNSSEGCTWVENTTSPKTITMPSSGTYYAFVKDAAENISTSAEFTLREGEAMTLGGYKWHVIGEDATKLWLLLDAFDGNGTEDSNRQIPNMAHCGNQDDSSNNCTFNGTYYVYSWDKSLIRTYLNKNTVGGFLYTLPENVKNKLISTDVCIDESMLSDTEWSYGGYTKEEITSLGVTCSSGYTSDKVRLISISELHNLSAYSSYANKTYPTLFGYNDNNKGYIPSVNYITRLNSNDWLSSSTIGSWRTMGAFTWNINQYSADMTKYSFLVSTSTNGTLDYSYSNTSRGVRPVIVLQK